MRPSVDLPQPDSPTRPTTSPSSTENDTSSTACTTSSAASAPSARDLAGEVERLHEALGDVLELEDLHSG